MTVHLTVVPVLSQHVCEGGSSFKCPLILHFSRIFSNEYSVACYFGALNKLTITHL